MAVDDLNFIAVRVTERGECSAPELPFRQAGELYAPCRKFFVFLVNVGDLKRQASEATDEYLILLRRIGSDRLNNKL